MERRFFIAILLSFVVLYGYQALVPPPPKAPTPASSPAPDSAKRGTVPDASKGESTSVAQPAIESAPAEGEEREREIVVDTATLQAVLTNRGGRVLRWRLKGFEDQIGNLVDLVPTDVPEDEARPFSLFVDDPALGRRLNSALYRVNGDNGGHVDATTQSAML